MCDITAYGPSRPVFTEQKDTSFSTASATHGRLGKAKVEALLTSLAVERHVAAATRNLALSAIPFLYREVLAVPLPWLGDVTRAKKPARLPTVLTPAEGLVHPSGGRQARHVQHQPFAAGARELDLHAGTRPLPFQVGNHAVAEFAVSHALADPQAGVVF